jgi:ABC-type amino acid transport substrate-binding protein
LEGITSIMDPKLKGKKVGIQAGAPAADYVAKAGLMPNAKSYLFIVDTRYQNPMQDMVADVRSGEIDVGILWGPHAGWYANHGEGEKLSIQPMLEEKLPGLPRLEYRITMGVRANETAWKHEINDVIAKRQGDIDKILLDYGVPIIDEDNKLITEPRMPKGTN